MRLARPGEEILALDEKTYALDPDMVVIADESGPAGHRRCHGRRALGLHRGDHQRLSRGCPFRPGAGGRHRPQARHPLRCALSLRARPRPGERRVGRRGRGRADHRALRRRGQRDHRGRRDPARPVEHRIPAVAGRKPRRLRGRRGGATSASWATSGSRWQRRRTRPTGRRASLGRSRCPCGARMWSARLAWSRKSCACTASSTCRCRLPCSTPPCRCRRLSAEPAPRIGGIAHGARLARYERGRHLLFPRQPRRQPSSATSPRRCAWPTRSARTSRSCAPRCCRTS